MARLRNLLVELYAKVDSREVHRVIREARRFRLVSGERRSLSERRARVAKPPRDERRQSDVARSGRLAAYRARGLSKDGHSARGAGRAWTWARRRSILPRHRVLLAATEPGRARGDPHRDRNGRR